MRKVTHEQVQKSEFRLFINISLFSACIGELVFILALRPEILARTVFLPTQISLAIPFILSSLFARARLGFTRQPELWSDFAFATFLIGYTFTVNGLGILLGLFVDARVAALFFMTNITLALLYSILEVREHPQELGTRVLKDLAFILLVFFGGILPAIGVW